MWYSRFELNKFAYLGWIFYASSSRKDDVSNGQVPISWKSQKHFAPEKPFVKLRPAYSVKLVFSYVVKRIQLKITAKFRASRDLSFEDTKRIMSPEMRPKSFGTFGKQAPGSCDKQKKKQQAGIFVQCHLKTTSPHAPTVFKIVNIVTQCNCVIKKIQNCGGWVKYRSLQWQEFFSHFVFQERKTN